MSDLEDLEEVAGYVSDRRKLYRRFRATGQIETHCKRGHELAGENVYMTPAGQRVCRKCKRLRILCREDS